MWGETPRVVFNIFLSSYFLNSMSRLILVTKISSPHKKFNVEEKYKLSIFNAISGGDRFDTDLCRIVFLRLFWFFWLTFLFPNCWNATDRLIGHTMTFFLSISLKKLCTTNVYIVIIFRFDSTSYPKLEWWWLQ